MDGVTLFLHNSVIERPVGFGGISRPVGDQGDTRPGIADFDNLVHELLDRIFTLARQAGNLDLGRLSRFRDYPGSWERLRCGVS
jgi:hypothetical protein